MELLFTKAYFDMLLSYVLLLSVVTAPVIIGVLLISPKILAGLKFIYVRKRAGESLDSVIEQTKNKLKQVEEKYKNVSIENLQNLKKFPNFPIKVVLYILWFLFVLPAFVLQWALIFTFGIKFIWRLPISVYEMWYFVILGLSFYYTYIHKPYLALGLAILAGLVSLTSIVLHFEKNEKRPLILRTPKHKFSMTSILLEGFAVNLSFASIYYAVHLLNPNSFSRSISLVDSIYFSVITAATIGYGDIVPNSDIVKIICMLEVIVTYVYTVFVIAVFMSVWLKNNDVPENISTIDKTEKVIEPKIGGF